MIPLSYSRLKDLACPFRFKALHVDKTHREPETPAMIVGSVFHKAIAKYRQRCMKMGVPSDPEALASYEPDVDYDDIAAEVKKLLTSTANSELCQVPVDCDWYLIEGKLSFDSSLSYLGGKESWLDENVAFRAIADAVYLYDGNLFIIDDKTGWGDPDERQLLIYASLVPSALPEEHRKSVKWINLTWYDHRRGQIIPAGEVEHEDDAIVKTKRFLLDKIREVQDMKDFPAVSCELCDYCSISDCPLRASVEKSIVSADNAPVIKIPHELTTHEDAEKAVEFLVFVDSIKSRITELLQSWIQEHGPVTAAGKIAEEKPNEPWKVSDLQGLAKAAVAMGIKPEWLWDAMTITEAKLKKLARNAGLHEGQLIMLMNCYGERKKLKPRFSMSKAPKEEMW
jgi:hypothetical protein